MAPPTRRNSIRTAAALIAGLAAAALLAGCSTAAPAPSQATDTAAPATVAAPATEPVGTPPATDAPGAPATSTLSAADATLLFVIEEEKLAHDVYVAMNELYDRNPFANIIDSETRHQDWLVPILEARGLDDPRTGVPGTFTDPVLQEKHDELVAKGEQSWADAVEVGIAIEEADIIDLKEAIEGETDPDAIAAYERLLAGSENHLAAFEAQR